MRIILISIVISLLFISCKEETTQPTANYQVNMFPLKTGNYWIYKFYKLDATLRPIDSTTAVDSIVVTSTKLNMDRTSYFLDVYRNNILSGNYIFSVDVFGIYRETDSTSEQFPDVKTGWAKIYDNMNESWSIYGSFIENIPYIFNNYETTCSRHIAINGSQNTSQDVIIVNGKSINSTPVLYKSDRKISFKYFEPNYPTLANIDIIELRNERIWFGDSVGITNWQFDPYSSIIRSDSSFCNYYKSNKVSYFNGWKRELLRYKLN